MHTVVILALGFYLAQGLGYFVHRLLHWPRAGALHRAHMGHHERLYPARDFLSETYRRPAHGENTVLLFAPFFVTLAVAVILALPSQTAALLLVELAALAWLNDCLHDALHVRGFWLERFAFFRRLRALHLQHHLEMRSNLGICCWVFDRILGSFRDPAIGRRARS